VSSASCDSSLLLCDLETQGNTTASTGDMGRRRNYYYRYAWRHTEYRSLKLTRTVAEDGVMSEHSSEQCVSCDDSLLTTHSSLLL
jgi:hypothetical protein